MRILINCQKCIYDSAFDIRYHEGMKKIIIILLLIPTLAMSGTFKDEEGKFGLKTKGSGFKFHLNFMDHNDYNFQYIKDKTKARAGNYFQ